jgi:hypothetical protein
VIDPELVTRKMVLIAEDLRALEPLARRPLADYLASPTDEVLAERYLSPRPRTIYHSFLALAGLGVLDRTFAERIAACAGLRNRIVHEYDAIDPARVPAALEAAVRDVPEYMRRVSVQIEKT